MEKVQQKREQVKLIPLGLFNFNYSPSITGGSIINLGKFIQPLDHNPIKCFIFPIIEGERRAESHSIFSLSSAIKEFISSDGNRYLQQISKDKKSLFPYLFSPFAFLGICIFFTIPKLVESLVLGSLAQKSFLHEQLYFCKKPPLLTCLPIEMKKVRN